MLEFTDGTFGGIRPADDLLRELAGSGVERVKALHFGTFPELERIRDGGVNLPLKSPVPEEAQQAAARLAAVEEELAQVSARLNEIAAGSHTVGVRPYPADALETLAPRLAAATRTATTA